MAEPDATAQADLSSALSNAFEGFRSDLTTPEPAQESSAPAPTPPVEATPSVPVPPVETVAAPAPTTIDTSTLTPEAKRFLDMHGGDPNKALAKALADNNRLAELHRSGQPTVPAAAPAAPVQATPPVAPVAPPTVAAQAPPPVELPPVVIDPAELQPIVKQAVARDQVCLQLDQTYTSNLTRLNAIQSEAQTHNTDIQKATWELTLPHVQGDPMAQADIQVRIRESRSNLLLLQQEKFVIETENARTATQWQARRDQYERQAYANLSEQRESERQTQYHAAQTTQAEQALEAEWPLAINASMQTHGIPAEELADFKEHCRMYAIGHLDLGMLDRVEVREFINERAVAYAASIVRHHRLEAAKYGQMATTRAAINSTPGPVAVATEAPKVTNMTLEQMVEAANAGFRSDIAASI